VSEFDVGLSGVIEGDVVDVRSPVWPLLPLPPELPEPLEPVPLLPNVPIDKLPPPPGEEPCEGDTKLLGLPK
jgi:hypothetical protein